MMNKIPKGWEVKKLKDIGKISSGGTPSTSNDNNFGGNIAWITPADLTGYKDKFISKGKRNLSEAGLKNSSAKILPKGTILFSSRAPIGYVAIAQNEISTNQGFKNLTPNESVISEYVYYYLLGSKNLAEQSASGTTFKEISATAFSNLPIPLPPLSEQKAIADKLDDSFAKIENAITNLINAKENLKLYKQSVLKSAFNGDLLPNTSPTHWEVKKLGEICEINPKTEILLLNESDEVSFIPMASVEAETNIFTESKSKFSKVKKGYTKFRDNDILFAKITPCMENGKICIVNNLKFGIGFGSTEFHVIRPNKNTLSKYIYYFVSQISFRQMAQIYMTGAVGQRRVPSKILENFEIPLPPLSEQNLIVAEIDRRFAIVDKTLNLIAKSIQNAKNLKQSILKKAFSGELRSEI